MPNPPPRKGARHGPVRNNCPPFEGDSLRTEDLPHRTLSRVCAPHRPRWRSQGGHSAQRRRHGRRRRPGVDHRRHAPPARRRHRPLVALVAVGTDPAPPRIRGPRSAPQRIHRRRSPARNLHDELLPLHLHHPDPGAQSRLGHTDARRRRRGGLERRLVVLEFALPGLAAPIPQRDDRLLRPGRGLLRRHELGLPLRRGAAQNRRMHLQILPGTVPGGMRTRAAHRGRHGGRGFPQLHRLALRQVHRGSGTRGKGGLRRTSRGYSGLELLRTALRQPGHRLDGEPPPESPANHHPLLHGGGPGQPGSELSRQAAARCRPDLRLLLPCSPQHPRGGLRSLPRALHWCHRGAVRRGPRRRLRNRIPRCRCPYPSRHRAAVDFLGGAGTAAIRGR